MRLELGERGGLERDMGMEIGLRRQDRLMPEPQCDDRQIDAGLEQLHGSGVPKDMRRYPLVAQRRTLLARHANMVSHLIGPSLTYGGTSK